ncbi:hypothetical protein HZA86_03230 [Candidatus Uhrbacteria bacterium]|nr:hypothetical protein [Candidatus Uhrbacteria bacterium]
MAFFSMQKAQPQKQTKTVWDSLYKQRYAISIFLAVIVLVAGGWFLVYPRWKVLGQAKDLTTEQLAKNEELRALMGRLQVFEKNYNQAKELESQSSITDVAAGSLDFARILTEVVAIAAESNVPLLSVSMGDGKDAPAAVKEKNAKKESVSLPKDVKSVELSLMFKTGGEYDLYKAFLIALERALPLYDVQTFNIGGNSTGDSTQITAQSYYYDSETKEKPKTSATSVSINPQ